MNSTNQSHNPANSQTHAAACILCSRNCGITITTENGKLTKIKGDPEHPTTKGYICQKAARLDHYQNHDDRLTHPLKRMPDGSFEKISWDKILTELAQKMSHIRDSFGGDAFAIYGGGGQGNHIGGAYGHQLLKAMGNSKSKYTALAQEKSMDFWLNGRIFGNQKVHTTEDIEHADYILFIGCNPFQAHGIPNARESLREIRKDPNRTMVVFDPRRTETAKAADIHFQLKSSTDAYLMSAILSIIVRENLHDKTFLNKHCSGFDALEKELLAIPVEEYVKKADVPLDLVQQVARGFAQAKHGCVRIDLGLQHSLHSTLTGYLEKMLYLVTGNFGKKGGNNLHTMFLPLFSNSDERAKELKRTAHHKMIPISGMLPPNILPDEIEHEGEDRIRAVWVDSSNPMNSMANTKACKRAFQKLELLVVVDVAMTETARLADYILPASSQFEKSEATGFNLEFPENFFHFRHPIFEPLDDTLPEAEIYTRLLEKMELIPKSFPVLEKIAKHTPQIMKLQPYLYALMATIKMNKNWAPYSASIMYRTLGKALPKGADSGAILLPLALLYANQNTEAVKRSGIKGNRITLGINLFNKIMSSRSGTIISQHEFKDIWGFIKNDDGLINLKVDKALDELRGLESIPSLTEGFPLILMAGERRNYNANQIFRNPDWRKIDKDGALRIHPEDAKNLDISSGELVVIKSKAGQIKVTADIDDTVREGLVTLPHGYGMRYKDSDPVGPELNALTSSDHCDPFTKVPYHKYVPVNVEKIPA